MTTEASSDGVIRFRLEGSVGDADQIFDLPCGVFRVGSSSASDIRLDSPGVSRQHALLLVSEQALVVEDRGSRNGTFLDGVKVSRTGVSDGAELSFGPVLLTVEERHGQEARPGVSLRPEGRTANEVTVGKPTDFAPASPPHESSARWLVLLAELAEAQAEGLSTSLGTLVRNLGAEAAALASWEGTEEPAVLGAWGTWNGAPPWEVAAASPSGISIAREGDHPWAVKVLRGEPRHRGLAVQGQFEGREECGPLLSAALPLLDRPLERPRASVLDGRKRPRLRFPDGYVKGTSAAMSAVYRQLEKLLKGTLPVLLLGPTGVGKEMTARILHDSSPRRTGPFVAVNCAALPADLIEAELFGIAGRVATGVDPRPGRFRLADGGTLFLDEVGELPLPAQAKLLRALQEREIQPLGSAPEAVDVRVVAATNADLRQAIESDGFRQDLYFRLAGYVLELPALTRCRDDIPALVEHFLGLFARELEVHPRGISLEALNRLTRATWPGNVRQLANEVRRLVTLSTDGQLIESGLLSPEIGAPTDAPPLGDRDSELDLRTRVGELERHLITQALERAEGVRLRAAELLGISRNGLAEKMKRLGLDR